MTVANEPVAALLVTSNSARWIEATLNSILGQTRQPDAFVVIDDNSTDDTRSIISSVLKGEALVYRATSRAADTTTRIAHNFRQGVRACADHAIAVLGDHDDVWHPDRIAHQTRELSDHPTALMLASDGALIDAIGESKAGSLREAFPVPDDWNDLAPLDQLRYVLRHSIATGGASALRPAAFADVAIPAGWLHDRWWSLVATVLGGMRIDGEQLIDYRVSGTQEVGLGQGRQRDSQFHRAASAATQAPMVLGKVRDLHAGLQPLTTDPTLARALSWAGLARALR